ncbi:MAG: endonuclease MutS2 [Ruminococcaceae bacterium]|nr:endonuclease MutS2 [Oscillospiraceae bacterium]
MGKNYTERLELDKILGQISELADCEKAKSGLLSLSPAVDIGEANTMLYITDEFYKLISRNSSPSVSPVVGIDEICKRAEKGGLLSMGELLTVKAMLKNARVLNSWYSNSDGCSECDRLFYGLYEDARLEREIGDSILSETEMSDDASGALKDIRKQFVRAEGSIRDKLDSIIRSSTTQKYLQDAVITLRGGRFVVPVKQEHKAEIKGLVHDVSSSGSTYFVEPEAVVEANNRIMELKGEEQREIDRILSVFSETVAGIGERLRGCYAAFVEIDMALAKARFSVNRSATRPDLNTDGRIVLKRARHPLIPQKDAVPIDVSLGIEYDSLIITGPNTGGKTVTLKTVGLLTLMAMCGILITANEGSEICVFSKVLVDIGDAQSIEQSLSTFSSHMKNISEIIKEADDSSLVLLDELGAGTDPAEGAALAIAILERLRGYGSRVLATTHYGELKIYALETNRVQNASCEFDVKTLRPTYKLNIGIPGRSNALLIGERLGLDSALLESAKRNMSSDDRRFEDVLNEIEKLKSELTFKQEEIETLKEKAKDEIEKGRQEKERLIAEGKRDMEAAKLKARRMVSDISASAYKLMDEIRVLESDKEKDLKAARQRAKSIANNETSRLLDLADPTVENTCDYPPVKSVKEGDTVFVVPLGREATVVTNPDSKGSVEVKAGNIKTKVSLKDLREPPKQKKTPVKKVNLVKVSGAEEKRSGRNEINLLGLTVEEAILETDRFIDGAMLSHIDTVYLIHGKGTGALRAGIQSHLRTLKQVKSFRLGKYGEGEDGVTIVELK